MRRHSVLTSKLGRTIIMAAFASALYFAQTSAAQAGPFIFTGFETSSQAAANAEGAYGTSLSALYLNPSLMNDLPPTVVMLSYMLMQKDFKVSLMKAPANSEVPLTYYDSDVGNEATGLYRSLPTKELPNKKHNNDQNGFNHYLTLGVMHNFGVKDLRLGLVMALPLEGAANLKTHWANELEQNFANTVHMMRFAEWNNMMNGMAGASYGFFDNALLVGASAQITITTIMKLYIFLPDANVEESSVSNDVDASIKIGVKPILGVTYRPFDWLSAALTWKYKSVIKADGSGVITVWNYHDNQAPGTKLKITNQNLPMVMSYEPMEASLAIGGKYAGFTGQFMVTWSQWSDYKDFHDADPGDAAYFDMNLWDPRYPKTGDAASIAEQAKKINAQRKSQLYDKYKFKDTWSFNASLAYKYLNWSEAKIGFGYYPTPVPDQLGRTNYADNDVMVATLGNMFTWEEFEFGVALQFWKMFDKTVYKDPTEIRDEFSDDAKTKIGGKPMDEAIGLQTNNPGFPGFKVGGYGVFCSVSAAYHF